MFWGSRTSGGNVGVTNFEYGTVNGGVGVHATNVGDQEGDALLAFFDPRLFRSKISVSRVKGRAREWLKRACHGQVIRMVVIGFGLGV